MIGFRTGYRAAGRLVAAIAAAAVLLPAHRAAATDIRLQASAGWAASVLDVGSGARIGGTDVNASLESLSNGDGPSFAGAVWVDNFVKAPISAGVQFIRSDFRRTVNVSGVVAGSPTTIESRGDVVLQTAFLNVAWRQNEGTVHPYVGIGGGAGYASVDVDVSALAAGTATDTSGTVGTVHAGGQGFFGIDVDLTDWLYAGLSGRIYYIDGRIIDEDLQFTEFTFLTNVGVKF